MTFAICLCETLHKRSEILRGDFPTHIMRSRATMAISMALTSTYDIRLS